ncbi:BLUF domain-containing protein [Anatilimnocola sp. NA78]|uniref:BLUF domain-containing protein n=1 Tax=Anatilimnocola sp. NA78 TaxID=3415683 RepID=UPI003CE46FD0
MSVNLSATVDVSSDPPVPTTAGKLWQIIYLSLSTHEFSERELEELLAKARSNNHPLGITGMLVYRDRCFLQVLEGPTQAVERLFEKIGQDPRHEDVSILMSGQLAERSFGDWRMGFVNTHHAEKLAGFSDFFGDNFSLQMFARNSSLARKTLLAFRDCRWH